MSADQTRPRRLVVIAGTGTEIGKTWVSRRVLELLAAEWSVQARKPAQSGDGDPADIGDAAELAAATGEDELVVCPPHRRYGVAMAPPMAAEALGLTPATVAELAAEVSSSWGARASDVGLVELAGGVASPMAIDGDGADLAAALSPDAVVLVADAGLGTVNAVRLSAARLAEALGADRRLLVVLNRYDDADDLHVRNRDWLATRDGFDLACDLATVALWIEGLAPLHCGSCGKPATECDGSCARPLDPERFCTRCGRRLVVTVTPTGHSARCKVHGPIAG
ncbi:MAG: AAA family ATPase [Acidimicrobiales bacterium]